MRHELPKTPLKTPRTTYYTTSAGADLRVGGRWLEQEQIGEQQLRAVRDAAERTLAAKGHELVDEVRHARRTLV